MSLHQNNKHFLVLRKRCFVSHWPPAYEINMLLITTFRSRKKPIAGRSPTGRLSTAALCRGLEKNVMVGGRHGRGMASVNQIRPHCVNQMWKTHSKPLAARHGRGTLCVNRPLCALLKAYSGERAWKAIDDRLRRPYCLSRVDHVRKIRDNAKNGYREVFLCKWNHKKLEPTICRRVRDFPL
jgi:hypothetical protein